MKNSIIAQDKKHLISLIKEEIKLHGKKCNLNHIDTSKITDMSSLFSESIYNGNISDWNVSNVITMVGMFAHSQFNGDISGWNVSNVINMDSMFTSSQFNKNISQWNVSSVTTMDLIFYNCEVEKPWWCINDNDKRQIAIDKYQLMQQLNNKLMSKKEINIPKKNKI